MLQLKKVVKRMLEVVLVIVLVNLATKDTVLNQREIMLKVVLVLRRESSKDTVVLDVVVNYLRVAVVHLVLAMPNKIRSKLRRILLQLNQKLMLPMKTKQKVMKTQLKKLNQRNMCH
jgi:hypothetical protein